MLRSALLLVLTPVKTLALLLVLALLLLPALVAAPARAAEPSFDCRTARTAREIATCGDARLAAADRENAVAWRDAIAHLDAATAKALREDQRKFLSDIDEGFNAELWGKQDPPEGEELRAQVAQLRRGGDEPRWRRKCTSASLFSAI